MKNQPKRLLSLVLALCLCLGLAACDQTTQNKNTETPAQSTVTENIVSAEVNTEETAEVSEDEYLASLQGTYVELFPAMDLDENKEIWYQNFKDVLGVEDEKTAETLRQMIIGMFNTDVYGAEAVAVAEENPGYGSFNCHFINGVTTFKFDGNTISGFDADGKEVFSRTYTKLDDVKYDFGAMNEAYSAHYTDETWPTMAIYVSDGEDDAFKYFAFCGDSPAETSHIEFRYGATLENLTAYYNGDYAYWLAAGFLNDAPDGMMEDCINLFVTENADGFAAFVEQAADSQ